MKKLVPPPKNDCAGALCISSGKWYPGVFIDDPRSIGPLEDSRDLLIREHDWFLSGRPLFGDIIITIPCLKNPNAEKT